MSTLYYLCCERHKIAVEFWYCSLTCSCPSAVARDEPEHVQSFIDLHDECDITLRTEYNLPTDFDAYPSPNKERIVNDYKLPDGSNDWRKMLVEENLWDYRLRAVPVPVVREMAEEIERLRAQVAELELRLDTVCGASASMVAGNLSDQSKELLRQQLMQWADRLHSRYKVKP